MDLTAARTLATRLIEHHGLTAAGWSFEFDRAPRRLGLTNWTTKRITLGRAFVEAASPDEVTQTILHEIAHALLPAIDYYGKPTGHGWAWRRQARSIGYRGTRLGVNPASR